jgi:hypothetical protein
VSSSKKGVVIKIKSSATIKDMRSQETRQAVQVKRNNVARSRNHFCSENEGFYILSVSVAFVIQNAKRMPRIILKSMACLLSLLNSSISYEKRARFSEQKLSNIKCVLTFSTTFVSNIFRSKKNLARYHRCVQVFM